MNYRINKRAILFVFILFFALICFFVYSRFVSWNVMKVDAPVNQDATSTLESKEEKMLSAKHQYLDAVHTLAGKAEVPTPCHRLLTESFFVGEDDTKSVEIRFSTLLEGEECPQQVYEVPFKVSFEAPEDITITATWNGDPVRLNLIPLKQGEIIDDELFIKG